MQHHLLKHAEPEEKKKKGWDFYLKKLLGYPIKVNSHKEYLINNQELL